MRKLLLAAAFTAMSLTAGATLAQEKQDLTPAQQAEGRLILETARNLASYGETKGDALALVTAAKMMASVPGKVLADGQKGDAGADKSQAFDIDEKPGCGNGNGSRFIATNSATQGFVSDVYYSCTACLL